MRPANDRPEIYLIREAYRMADASRTAKNREPQIDTFTGPRRRRGKNVTVGPLRRGDRNIERALHLTLNKSLPTNEVACKERDQVGVLRLARDRGLDSDAPRRSPHNRLSIAESAGMTGWSCAVALAFDAPKIGWLRNRVLGLAAAG